MSLTNEKSSSGAAGEAYDVSSQITELRFPRVTGYSQAEVAFNGGSSTAYNLNEVVAITGGPFVPVQGSSPLLRVDTQVLGSTEPTATQYLYYTISEGNYLLYTSPNSDGSGATQIGTVPTSSTDPNKTSLKAEYVQPASAKPVIVIGDITIDPPIRKPRKEERTRKS